MLSRPRNRKLQPSTLPDQFGRTPHVIEALNNVENIDAHLRERVLEKRELARIAKDYGLQGVVRWKPRQVSGAVGAINDATNLFWEYR